MSPLVATRAGASAAGYGWGMNLAPSDAHVLIATQTVGAGGAASVTFSSIPSTFKHLQIRAVASFTTGTGDLFFNGYFNGDTAANYSYHQLNGSGTSVLSTSGASRAGFAAGYFPFVSSNANTFGAMILDVLDYASTVKNKTVRVLGGTDMNGSGELALLSGGWYSTAAITSITLTPASSTVAQYSTFALYGIKG